MAQIILDVWIQPCTDSAAQQFKAEPVTGGYRLVAKHSNKCLEVPGGATGFGIDMAQQACTTAAHQKWTITDPNTSTQQSPPAAAVIAADAITSRDLTDRILNQAINGHDPNGATPNFTYDKAARLTAAVNFAGTPASGAPVRTTSYDYTSTACGLTPTAGRNGNRVAKTTNGSTVAYCYDHADRLTATTDPAAAAVNTTAGTLGYDTHGNTSRLAGETHTYDIADRHIQTGPADPANPDDMATVTYTRDATDRIVTRQASDEDEVHYAHTGAGDAPQLTLNSSNQVVQTSIGLPGGAVLHRTPPNPGTEKWSYPNLQGSIITQTNSIGIQTGGPFLYDPDGIPIHGGLPDTRPGTMDDTYLGGHSRPLEHAEGLQPIIEMGARQYHPILARFLEIDPIEGGVLNDYGYVTDPTNQTDLTGRQTECAYGQTANKNCTGTQNGGYDPNWKGPAGTITPWKRTGLKKWSLRGVGYRVVMEEPFSLLGKECKGPKSTSCYEMELVGDNWFLWRRSGSKSTLVGMVVAHWNEYSRHNGRHGKEISYRDKIVK